MKLQWEEEIANWKAEEAKNRGEKKPKVENKDEK